MNLHMSFPPAEETHDSPKHFYPVQKVENDGRPFRYHKQNPPLLYLIFDHELITFTTTIEGRMHLYTLDISLTARFIDCVPLVNALT